MANELEAVARLLLARQGGAGAAGLEKLGAYLKTPDGQRVLTLLATGGGAEQLKVAAQSAIAGDEAGAKAAILSLAATPDGAALLKTLISTLGKAQRT